ncbi:MAG: DUF6077 domain-containing protein [Fusicatenibacter sp.]|nr:DUF6077 domain-containing protein [Fusicatenibacter sp.]
MLTMIKIAAVFLGMLFLFFCFGSYFVFEKRREAHGIARAVLFGFIAYYFLFELISFPMMLAQTSLRALTTVWTIVVVLVAVTAFVRYLGEWKNCLDRQRAVRLPGQASFYVMLLVIGFQCYLVAVTPDNSVDSAYYVANVSTNLATNTINCYDPFTGAALEGFNIRYLFGMYPVANSVVCDLTGIHPLVLTKVVLFVMTVVLSYLVYAQIGFSLFGEKKESVWLMLCFISILNLCFHTLYSNASFLLTRGYEGKAILSNVILPLVFYFGLCLYEKMEDRNIWKLIFMTGIAAVDISMSSMLIVPAAVSAVVLPQIVMKKKWKQAGKYVVCMIPSAAVLIVYFLGSRGILQFPIVH